MGWLEKLLLLLIILASLHGLATAMSHSAGIGMAVGVLALTLVAVASTALDKPAISRHTWHSYLEQGKLPARPIPAPRFRLAAPLELMVLGGIVFGVARYLHDHHPWELPTYLASVGCYLWIVFWSVVAALAASQSLHGERSPIKSAGICGSIAALAYLTAIALLFGMAELALGLCCFGPAALMFGVIFAMPIAALIRYWSHRRE